MYEAYFTRRLLEALTLADEADDARERSVHLRTSRYYRDLLQSDRRHSVRHSVAIEAIVHHAAPGPRRVIVSDLSSCGFRMTFDEPPLDPGRRVVLDIHGLAPVDARIIWHDGEEAGCQFLDEIHPSLVDAALAISPRPE